MLFLFCSPFNIIILSSFDKTAAMAASMLISLAAARLTFASIKHFYMELASVFLFVCVFVCFPHMDKSSPVNDFGHNLP